MGVARLTAAESARGWALQLERLVDPGSAADCSRQFLGAETLEFHFEFGHFFPELHVDPIRIPQQHLHRLLLALPKRDFLIQKLHNLLLVFLPHPFLTNCATLLLSS